MPVRRSRRRRASRRRPELPLAPVQGNNVTPATRVFWWRALFGFKAAPSDQPANASKMCAKSYVSCWIEEQVASAHADWRAHALSRVSDHMASRPM